MRKLLSMALAILLLVSCVSVGITSIAAATSDKTVTTSVIEQNGLNGGYIKGESSKTVAPGSQVTVEAVPYYGNTFEGWYDGTTKVSADATYTFTADDSVALQAKFNIYNQVEDGSFEANNGEGAAFFNKNEINAGPAGFDGVVSDVPAGSSALHGSKAFYLDSANSNTSAYLFNFPATVEKNTDYVFHFSFYSVGAEQLPLLTLHANESFSNVWTASAKIPSFTYHWEPEGTTNTAAHSAYGAIRSSGVTYQLLKKQLHTTVNSGSDKWVDAWFVFNSGDDNSIFADGKDTGKIWLAFGLGHNGSTPYYVDNVSFAEASASKLFSVEATAGGKVQYNGSGIFSPDSAYYINNNGNKIDTIYTVDAAYTRYAQVVTGTGSYTAAEDSGYIFTGWYKDGATTAYSMNATETFTQAGTYVAKFSGPPTAGEGGYLVDDNNGNLTAKPYYGNSFLGWYKGETKVGSDLTVSVTDATYADSVAKFGIYNKATDGGFDQGIGNVTVKTPTTGSVAEMTEANGNKFLRMTSETSGANWHAFYWSFKLEQGKRYIISYDLRAALDAEGNHLSSENMAFRRFVVQPSFAADIFRWKEISFASQKDYKNNALTNATAVLLPSGNAAVASINSDNEWANYAIVLDTTTATIDGATIVNPDGTIDLGLTFSPQQGGGKLALDIDNVLITEILGEYEVVSANDTHGTATTDRKYSTPGLPVTMTATANSGYAFYAWYNEQGTKVNTNSTITSADVPAGKYTAKFVGNIPQAGKGGTIDDSQGNGVITATPFYGNKFDGWYDPESDIISNDATVDLMAGGNQAKYKGAEARFKIYNKADDGKFDVGTGNVELKSDSYSATQMTETNGNKYLRMTSTTAGNSFHSFQWNFKLEQGKKYVISYDMRPSFDDAGNNINSAGMNYRAMLLQHTGANVYKWNEIAFASKIATTSGSKFTETKPAVLCPSNGLFSITGGADDKGNPIVSHADGFRYGNDEWVNYSIVIDTTTATIFVDTDEDGVSDTNKTIINDDGTIDLGLTFGANVAGTLALDIDNLLITEILDEYVVKSANDSTGTVTADRKFTTPGLSVTMTATAADGYEFYAWYDDQGNKLSLPATFTSNDAAAGTYTAKFIGAPSADKGGYVTIDGAADTAIAFPYYGNAFDGWYDKDDNPITGNMELSNASANRGAVAKFIVENKAEDGRFDSTGNNIVVMNKYDPTVDQKYYNYTELLEENGNKFIRLNSYWDGTESSVSNHNRLGAFRYGFSVEKDKKYIISYKLRSGHDNTGVNLNTANTFRRAIVPQDGNGGYQWKEITFASFKNYVKGTKSSLYEVNPTYTSGFFLPSTGTSLSYGANMHPYSVNPSDWVTYSVVIDTTTATIGFDNDGDKNIDTIESIINPDDNTIDLYLTFFINSAGIMALDLDDVLIAEVENEYYAHGSDDNGNSVSINNIATTKYAKDVIMEAFPNYMEEYFFIGWHNEADILVNSNPHVAASTLPAGTYTAKFAQTISAGNGGTIVNNYDGTYTAHAFYGNKFLGWSLNGTIVNSEYTIESNASNKGIVATFTTDNLIYNGDFEVDDYGKTYEKYSNFPNYSDTVPGWVGIVSVEDFMEDSGPEYGETALLLSPNTSHDHDMSPVWEKEEDGKTNKLDENGKLIPVYETDEAGNTIYGPDGDPIQKYVPSTTKDAKAKSLLNIPVTLEAGKTYLWKMSYTYLANYDNDKHQLNFSVDKANDKGRPGWSNTIDYSYHSQLASYTNDKTDITKNVNDNVWSWGKAHYTDTEGKEIKKEYLNTKNASGGYEWVDLYVTFTADEGGIYFLTLGTPNTCVDNVIVDNISLTEVFSDNLTTVTAGKNGTVSSYRADVPAFKATKLGGTGVFVENKPEKEGEPVKYPGVSVDKTKPMYAKMYVTYFAEPDLGYSFEGWFKNGECVSTEPVLTVYAQGDGEYTAKFKNDPKKYYLTATVEKQDGIYGGYITSDTTFNDLLKNQKVTVSATAYDGNHFDGWYTEDGKCVSRKSTYSYKVTKDTKLVAMFYINNTFVDSGYENTKQNASILGEGKEWTSDYKDAYGNAISLHAKKGDKSANLSANGYDIRHKNMAVAPNTIYHLAFNWMLSVANTDEKPATLEYVKVYNADTGALLAETSAVKAKGVENWQKVAINFDTKDATSIYFVLKYKANIASIYIDELVLVDTDMTPFVINAELETDGTIYPGYITSEETAHFYLNDQAWVGVQGYKGNIFLGWYKDGEKVSDKLDYSFTATEFATYTAKFDVKNLIPDSGYENTKPEQSMSDLGLWEVKQSIKESYGFDIFVSSTARQPFTGSDGKDKLEIYAHDGNQLLRVNHRNNNIGTHVSGLKENTNYVFSFFWQVQNTSQFDEDTEYTAYFQSVKLTGNKTGEELGAGRAVGVGEAASYWQEIYIPFNSGNNTEMDITLCYNAGSGYCFIDDFAVYEADYVTLVDNKGGYIVTDFEHGMNGPAQRGTQISVTAVPFEGHKFLGWYDYSNPNILISKDATYNFTVNGSVALYAMFEGPLAEEINWFIDGDFENYYMTAPTFDHPRDSSDWCSYGVVNSAGSIKPVSGNNFLRINAHSRYTNFLISNLEPATTYTVSFWYNTNSFVNMGRIDMYERYYEQERKDQKTKGTTLLINPARNYSRTDSYGKSIGSINIYSCTNGEWKKAEYTFTTVNRRQVYMHIEHSRSAGSGALYFDDIRIEKRSGGYTDTVVDGDFQTTTTDGGWIGSFGLTKTADNIYATVENEIHNNINLLETRAYTVTFKARSATEANMMFGLTRGGCDSLVDADGTVNAFTGASYDTVKLTKEWKEYTLNFTAAGYFQYSLFFKALDGAFDIDDVAVNSAKNLVNAHKVTFEANEKLGIYESLLQAVNKDYPGNWQGHGYNNRYFEIYNGNDGNVHSGNGSLVMHENPIEGSLTESQQKNYENGGNYLSHPLYQTWSSMVLRPGKTYTITYWAKAQTAGTQYTSQVLEVDNKWVWTAIADDVITLDTTEWTKITQTFTCLETMNTHANNAYFVFNSLKGKTKGDIYFDDIEIFETANSVTNANTELLYTQDISQNYIENYSFESAEGQLGAFSKADSDAFYGEKVGTFNKGDKLVLEIDTRTDYNIEFASEYTLAASIKGDSNAKGYIALSYNAAGTELISDKNGNPVKLAVNTDGKWKRSGFTFTDFRNATVFLVIVCEEGTFNLDYLAMFNENHSYDSCQTDYSKNEFDVNNKDNFVDMGTAGTVHDIPGNIAGLPDDSQVVFVSDTAVYTADVDASGDYVLEDVANGTYDMYVAAGDTDLMTLWGDITITPTTVSGLACERLNGEITVIEGKGVRNGIVKIIDDETGWAYLTATDEDGQFCAYIGSEYWYVEGMTNDEDALDASGITLEQFELDAAAAKAAANRD